MVTLRIKIVAAPAARSELNATLLSLVGPVRAQTGCAATRVFSEMDEDRTLTFEAEWRTQSDLQQHFRTPAFRTLLAAMELASEPPVFEVDLLDRRLGFEFVEEVLETPELQTAVGQSGTLGGS